MHAASFKHMKAFIARFCVCHDDNDVGNDDEAEGKKQIRKTRSSRAKFNFCEYFFPLQKDSAKQFKCFFNFFPSATSMALLYSSHSLPAEPWRNVKDYSQLRFQSNYYFASLNSQKAFKEIFREFFISSFFLSLFHPLDSTLFKLLAVLGHFFLLFFNRFPSFSREICF